METSTAADWSARLSGTPDAELLAQAAQRRDARHGIVLSYSRKVFVPLTQLCRDACHYCTFAKTPGRLAQPYLDPDSVLDIVQRGAQAGCTEVLFTLRLLGECAVPTTTGILVGIGETWDERIDALQRIERLYAEFGHIQEVIVQNFRAKPGTRMARVPEPTMQTHLRTIAAARLVLNDAIALQAPPNLTDRDPGHLIDAGIDDWGGISPVTIDHVNPEAPWPQVGALARSCARRGKTLVQRLPIYPAYALQPTRWIAPAMRAPTLRAMDAAGLAREDRWVAGDTSAAAPAPLAGVAAHCARLQAIESKLKAGAGPDHDELVFMFASRGPQLQAVLELADRLRRHVCGERVRYVVNRNINYTNLCKLPACAQP